MQPDLLDGEYSTQVEVETPCGKRSVIVRTPNGVQGFVMSGLQERKGSATVRFENGQIVKVPYEWVPTVKSADANA